MTHGLMQGDFSTLARLFRSLAPMVAGLRDLPHLLFGFGMGNVKTAILRGYDETKALFVAWRGNPDGNGEIRLLASTSNQNFYFTMNAYVSFITEFGVIMALAFLTLLLVHVTVNHAWSKTTVCWLILLCYLYIQFEGYAFYALWLYIWAIGLQSFNASAVRENDSIRVVGGNGVDSYLGKL